MMTMKDKSPERDEIELLLPWHAAGTLGVKDAERVDAALENDAELRRRFELAREECGEAVPLNETLGAPSSRSLERLFAAIEAESPAPKPQMASAGGWFSGLLAQFSPRALAWSASAAALLILLQGALITGFLIKDRAGTGTYETASRDGSLTTTPGAFVLVRFNPAANAADITKFLDANEASILDGPRGGLYRLRVSTRAIPKADLANIVPRLQQETGVVAFVVPTE